MTKLVYPTPAARQGHHAYADLFPGESAPFGTSKYYKGVHHGTDWYWLNADVAGSRKVYAAAPGTVVEVKHDDATLGNWVTIEHAPGVRTRYCHMAKYPVVSVGQQVNTDTYLGPMGNTGSAANGQYHLHFELWLNGNRVDPAPYFSQDLPGTAQPAPPAPTDARTRVIKTGGAKRRSQPSTDNAIGQVLEVVPAGFSHVYYRYVHSPLTGGSVDGDDVWLDGGGWWVHRSTVTNAALDGIPDGTADVFPPAPPTPPVEVIETPPEEDPSTPPVPGGDDTPDAPQDPSPDPSDDMGNTDAKDQPGYKPPTWPVDGPSNPDHPIAHAAPTPSTGLWVVVGTAVVGGIGWLIAWITSLFH